MEIFWTLAAILLCLMLEGFFSGSEIGIVSADRNRLRHQASSGSKGASLALSMLKEPEWLLATTLVGTNIAVVTNTTLATALAISLFGASGEWVAIALVAPLIWVMGEIVPKSVFQQRADVLTPWIVYPLRVASYVFFPVLAIFTTFSRVLSKVFGGQQNNPFTLREEMVTMIQLPAATGDIEPLERKMIRRLFRFSESVAREIMTPLIDVVAIDREASCGEAARLSAESSHLLLPVFEERVDNIVGVMNALETLGVDPNRPVESYVRPVRYATGSTGVRDLLVDLRKEGDSLAVVIGEFGGAQGIVTIEDIVEEVVEDIEDEYDVQEDTLQRIKRLGEQDYIVDARIELDELAEQLGIALPEGKYHTLAGFLLEKAREIPPVGSDIKANHVTFTIKRRTPRAIKQVRVRW